MDDNEVATHLAGDTGERRAAGRERGGRLGRRPAAAAVRLWPRLDAHLLMREQSKVLGRGGGK